MSLRSATILVLVALFLVACDSGIQRQQQHDDRKENIQKMRDVLANRSSPPDTIVSSDARLSQISKRVDGFAGFYKGSNGRINVLLTDLTKKGAALTEIRDFLRGSGTAPSKLSSIKYVKAENSFDELYRAKLTAREIIGSYTIVYTDIDEVNNELVIAVSDMAERAGLVADLVSRGVNPSLISVSESKAFDTGYMQTEERVLDPFDPYDPPTLPPDCCNSTVDPELTDRVRPVVGGLEIQYFDGTSPKSCTVGFNAEITISDFFGSEDVSGFVTNSHCTGQEAASNGVDFYQDTYGDSGDYIGYERLDPPASFDLNNCPPGFKCRYSDAAFVAYDPSVSFQIGQIAHTDFSRQSTGSTTITNPPFVIEDYLRFPYRTPMFGDEISKMGKSTGWTTGTIVNTCIDLPSDDQDDLMYVCQYESSAGADIGDSGAPVFGPFLSGQSSFGTNQFLFGIVSGRKVISGNLLFSDMMSVSSELTYNAPWELTVTTQ